MRIGEQTRGKPIGFIVNCVAHVPADATELALLPVGTIALSEADLARKVLAGVVIHALTAVTNMQLLRAQIAAVSRYLVAALESLAYAITIDALSSFATVKDRAAAPNAEALLHVPKSTSAPISRDSLVVPAESILVEIGIRLVDTKVPRCRLYCLL